jgi:hypothetical protein
MERAIYFSFAMFEYRGDFLGNMSTNMIILNQQGYDLSNRNLHA